MTGWLAEINGGISDTYGEQGFAFSGSIKRFLQRASVMLLESLVHNMILIGLFESAFQFAVYEPSDADDVIARADTFEQFGGPLDLVDDQVSRLTDLLGDDASQSDHVLKQNN